MLNFLNKEQMSYSSLKKVIYLIYNDHRNIHAQVFHVSFDYITIQIKLHQSPKRLITYKQR